MNTNVNLEAPLAALTLLGTGFLIFVAAVVLMQSLIVRRRQRAKVVLIAMSAMLALYALTLVISSSASHFKLLARGQEKYFCELDCHLAYSIVNVTQTASPAGNETVVTVTVQTRFDQHTIAASRSNEPLFPNSRVLTLFDNQGNRYQPASEKGPSLTTPLHPGESYTTGITFNLPASAKPVRLLINEADWITHLVIGHENSPLHKKTEFQL